MENLGLRLFLTVKDLPSDEMTILSGRLDETALCFVAFSTSSCTEAGTNVMTGETITIGPDTKVPPTTALIVEYSIK